LSLCTSKPLTSEDEFNIVIRGASTMAQLNQAILKKISVVPNPYLCTALWEPRNSITAGRAERRIDFINVPANATIRIYTVRGDLVSEIRHDGNINSGAVPWDMISRDGLPIAYGVYVYHVSAPSMTDDFIGKFAVIK